MGNLEKIAAEIRKEPCLDDIFASDHWIESIKRVEETIEGLEYKPDELVAAIVFRVLQSKKSAGTITEEETGRLASVREKIGKLPFGIVIAAGIILGLED